MSRSLINNGQKLTKCLRKYAAQIGILSENWRLSLGRFFFRWDLKTPCIKNINKQKEYFNYFPLFFFYLGFLSQSFKIHRTAEERGGNLFNSFHLLHRHLDISQVITAESSPLHIASSQTRTGNL